MPVSVEFTEDHIGVLVRQEGTVTGDELCSAIASVYEDDRFLTLKYWIADRTSCTNFDVSKSSAQQILLMNSKESSRNPGILLALVAPRDIEFGLSRLFQSYSVNDKFVRKVFRDLNQAKLWIEKELSVELEL